MRGDNLLARGARSVVLVCFARRSLLLGVVTCFICFYVFTCSFLYVSIYVHFLYGALWFVCVGFYVCACLFFMCLFVCFFGVLVLNVFICFIFVCLLFVFYMLVSTLYVVLHLFWVYVHLLFIRFLACCSYVVGLLCWFALGFFLIYMFLFGWRAPRVTSSP